MRTVRSVLTVVLGGGALLAGALAAAAPASADTVAECTDGVTVVVDFTDIGGEVESACVEEDPETGRDALELAGFTSTDDDSGLICAIDGLPDDPCGAFEGSYWAYWQVVDGDWAASTVGADEYDPTPGGIEGWRYNDGSAPPPLPGSEAVTSTDAATSEPSDETTTGDGATTRDDTSTDGADESEQTSASAEATTDAGADADGGSGPGPVLGVALGVVVIGVVVGLVIRRRGAGSTS